MQKDYWSTMGSTFNIVQTNPVHVDEFAVQGFGIRVLAAFFLFDFIKLLLRYGRRCIDRFQVRIEFSMCGTKRPNIQCCASKRFFWFIAVAFVRFIFAEKIGSALFLLQILKPLGRGCAVVCDIPLVFVVNDIECDILASMIFVSIDKNGGLCTEVQFRREDPGTLTETLP